MGSRSRLLIIDRVLPDQPNPFDPIGYLVDMTMLALTPGGRERTETQFRALLASADFELEKVISVGGISDIVEAERRRLPAERREEMRPPIEWWAHSSETYFRLTVTPTGSIRESLIVLVDAPPPG